MAQLNITLDQDEILQVLGDSSGEAFRLLLQGSLNALLKTESAEQLRAQPYERCDERTDSRNGTRDRPLTTRVGTLILSVPRHRNVPFKTLVFENYQRSESALITTMAEMVVAGVSTAKVGKVTEIICGKSFSKQAVSEACKELDGVVEAFRNKPIEGRYLFAMADATYLKVREEHRVRAKALMIALGYTADGRKEIIGFDLAECEDRQTWKSFLHSLKDRGLSDIRMFASDAHEGLAAAIQDVFPNTPWQRCQAHFARNIIDAVPKHLRAGLRSELTEMFNSATLAAAREKRDEIIADYAQHAPKAMECLDAGFDDAMTVMELPDGMRRCTRTTNILERLNREVKRRSKVIGVFPNVGSVVRLVGAFLIEENDRWAAGRKMYYSSSREKLESKATLSRLEEIARNQKILREAA